MYKQILSLVLFTFSLFGKSIVETYSFDPPLVKYGQTYAEIQYEDCKNFGNEGEPLYPLKNISVLLPQNTEIKSISIVSSSYYHELNDIIIQPASRPFPLSKPLPDNYVVKPKEEIYLSNGPYPDRIIDNTTTQFLSGHSLANFSICPIKYYPKENKIEPIRELTIKIETVSLPQHRSPEHLLKSNQNILKRIQQTVSNTEMLNSYTYSDQSRDDEFDILIITSNNLLSAFQSFIEFKQSTGFLVTTVTTASIFDQYEGQDLQEKIRNCIIDYYINNNIKYVILGGDSSPNGTDNIIPHRGFYVDTYYRTTDTDIPSDMYYSCLDGNWNNDEDNYWGEPGEEDLYSEVLIGRLCVDSPEEIINQTYKLMMYQNSPVIGDIEKALFLGEYLWPGVYGGAYKDEVAFGSTNHGYTTTGLSDNFQTTFFYEMNESWDKFDIFNQFNNEGVHLRNHLGHSYVDYNMLMTIEDLTLNNFTNDGITRGYVIGYSQGCYNGSFDNRDDYGYYYSEDCFAEKITTMETADVATIGNSRYGWGDGYGTDGASQYFDRQFFDAIFGEDITEIGETNSDSKEDNVSYILEDPVIRWCAYELTLFGDPSMDIWTAMPVDMTVVHPDGIPIGTQQVIIQTDVPNARVGLTQNGSPIGRALTDDNGLCNLTLFGPITNPSPVNISVIAHNRHRYEGTIIIITDEPYIIYHDHEIDDSTGNNNSIVNAGETITLSLSLYNLGMEPALGVSTVIQTDDQFFTTIIDSINYYGDITPSDSSWGEGTFSFSVGSSCPNNYTVLFTVRSTSDDGYEWNSYFTIDVVTPEIIVSDNSLDFGTVYIDYPVTLTLNISNSGSETLMITNIYSDIPEIDIDIISMDIEPEGNQDIAVTLIPTQVEVLSGSLFIESNDPNEPVINIDVNGETFFAPIISISSDSLSSTLLTEDTLSQSLTITNFGYSDLIYDAVVPFGNNDNDQAAYFDGNDSYISFQENVITTQFFTIEAWAKMNGEVYEDNRPIFQQRNNFTDDNDATVVLFAEHPNGNTKFSVRSSIGGLDYAQAPYPSYDEWHHYAGVVSPTTISLYIDGELVDSSPNTQQGNYVTSIDYVEIGRHRYFSITNSLFNGNIDEVRIWNYARTSEEIQSTMHLSLTGNEYGLNAYWHFNNENPWVDISANGNNGFPFGNMSTIPSTAPLSNWLSINMSSNVIIPGEYSILSAEFNSSNLSIGQYSTSIDILCNDPNLPLVNIPVTLNVVPYFEVELPVETIEGWNLVGLSVIIENPYHLTIFPNAIENTLFTFTGDGYINRDSLQSGEGYWLRFPQEGLSLIDGQFNFETTINLHGDWNLISGVSNQINISAIEDPNELIIPGTVYGFGPSGYTNTDTIVPGYGYWIRSVGEGEIMISTNRQSNHRQIHSTVPVDANILTMNGDNTLYFGIQVPKKEQLSYSLPPIPPAGAFDIRFSDNFKFCQENGIIEIRNHTTPINIDFTIREGECWEIEDNKGEKTLLMNSGTLIIPQDVYQLNLKNTSFENNPVSYFLGNAFPNPFNPITTIPYQLPEDGKVEVIILDILGRQISSLVNEHKPCGYYKTLWDASNHSSGIYFVKMVTKNYSKTSKILLLK